MKYFFKLFVLFISPIILLIGGCIIILYYGGELFIEKSLNPLSENQLIGIAYTDINAVYKYKMINQIQPDIIALGSSRIMQVKENIIDDDYSFYNAGGVAGNLYEYEFFINAIHYTPKLVVLNIDQWAFNPNYTNQKSSFKKDWLVYKNTGLLFKCKRLLIDLILGKIRFSKIFDIHNNNIGLNGKVNNNGFLKDGSYYYGYNIKFPSDAEDYNFKDTYRRIKDGRSRFEYCDVADSSNLETIDRFLSYCSVKGITVVAILPPFAPEVCKRMNESGIYRYMGQIYGILIPLFERYKNCYLYDYTDMTYMGVHNYDFIDGFHGSEIVYNIIIQDILTHNSEIAHFFKSHVDINNVNEQYKSHNIRYNSFE